MEGLDNASLNFGSGVTHYIKLDYKCSSVLISNEVFLFEMFFSQRLVLPKTGISPPEYDFNWDIDY